MKENLLISSCLCGNNCTYKKTNNKLDKLDILKEKYNLIAICPEVMGGLSIPRISSEIKDNIVFNKEGLDVSNNFLLGATKALFIAQKYNCTKAILKEKSPSCGVNYIYDGSFNSTLIKGSGVTAKILVDNNISIYSDKDIDILIKNNLKLEE